MLSVGVSISSLPEFASSVGVRLEVDDSLTVIAAHGLDDWFSMVIRRNPVRVSEQTYRERVKCKRYVEHWLMATLVLDERSKDLVTSMRPQLAF